MNSLDIYHNVHIEWLKEVISAVPPGEDISPILSISAPDHSLIMMPFPAGPDAREQIKDMLKDFHADHYATITAAWITSLEGLSREEADHRVTHAATFGTAGMPRQECYVVSAGDRNETKVAVFVVKRDEVGKITGLTRQSELEGGMWAGSMCDLLMEMH